MKRIIVALALAIMMATVAVAADIKNEAGDVVAQTLEDKTGVKGPAAKTPTLPDLEAEFQGLQVQLKRLQEVSLSMDAEDVGKRMQAIVGRMNELQKLAAPLLPKAEPAKPEKKAESSTKKK